LRICAIEQTCKPANARRLGLGKEIPTDWFLQKEHT
jgi:hypothetical protein